MSKYLFLLFNVDYWGGIHFDCFITAKLWSSTCVVLTFFAYPHIAYQYQWSVETFVAVSGLDHI